MTDDFITFKENKNSYFVKAKSNNSVILSLSNFTQHIKKRHPEMTVPLILDILVAPDMVYKPSRSSKDKYYEKTIDDKIYRVVVSRSKPGERVVATAYYVEFPKEFIYKHTYCIYNKDEDEGYMQASLDLIKSKYSTT